MRNRRKSRVEKAGEMLGKAIVEMVNLMYQNNTARNFLNGVYYELSKSEVRTEEYIADKRRKRG